MQSLRAKPKTYIVPTIAILWLYRDINDRTPYTAFTAKAAQPAHAVQDCPRMHIP